MTPSGRIRRHAWLVVLRWVRTTFPDVAHVSVRELERWLDTDVASRPVLLDTRSEAEYAISHLPGARRFEAEMSDSELKHVLPPETPIIAYCSIGYRSSSVVRRLAALGYRDVRNLEGSIFYWANEGGELVRNGKPVREVHPFNRLWGLLLDRRLRARIAKAGD